MNNIEIWTLSNQTMVAHPFHIHGVQFYVLDRDGNAPPANEQGRKDVVLVSPNETVRFIAKFEDFADSITPYMYHCHVLMHEDDGMMGQYVINPLNTGVKEINDVNNLISIYPNPTNGIVNIETPLIDVKSISVYNALGELVYSDSKSGANQTQLNTTTWSKGIYNVVVTGRNRVQNKKLIVN